MTFVCNCTEGEEKEKHFPWLESGSTPEESVEGQADKVKPSTSGQTETEPKIQDQQKGYYACFIYTMFCVIHVLITRKIQRTFD